MFVQPSLAHPDVMLVWLTAEDMWRTDNKIYHQISSKADMLSCLSTAMVAVQKPLLPIGVVNPQQFFSDENQQNFSSNVALHELLYNILTD